MNGLVVNNNLEALYLPTLCCQSPYHVISFEIQDFERSLVQRYSSPDELSSLLTMHDRRLTFPDTYTIEVPYTLGRSIIGNSLPKSYIKDLLIKIGIESLIDYLSLNDVSFYESFDDDPIDILEGILIYLGLNKVTKYKYHSFHSIKYNSELLKEYDSKFNFV